MSACLGPPRSSSQAISTSMSLFCADYLRLTFSYSAATCAAAHGLFLPSSTKQAAHVARVWLRRPCRAGGLRWVKNPIETDIKPILGSPEASCPISWVLGVISDVSGVAVGVPGSSRSLQPCTWPAATHPPFSLEACAVRWVVCYSRPLRLMLPRVLVRMRSFPSPLYLFESNRHGISRGARETPSPFLHSHK